MTENDIKLIEQARSASYLDWDLVSDLADKADTEEARREIKRISVTLWHIDEHKSGLG